MNQHLAAAIDTAAQYQIAAPEQAPNVEVSGALGGALIIGLIIATVIITKWKNDKLSDNEKKSIVLAVIMTICLYGGSGLVGQLFSSVKDTANQTGNTIQQTSVGR
ncbi:hypothetical protein ACFZDG_18400 [Kitasatospora xanthocidica]|uniref:hypothetical protein n=1 Tax=Kitasatospora xanthocidica TaxID=83382 RepID=UPI0036E2B4D5